MGNLAFLGSHQVNGVSALHTDLMRKTVFHDLHNCIPERIINETNGITFRRWLQQANPGLTALLIEAVGPRVLDDANALADLRGLADDAAFQRAHSPHVRHANKVALAELIRRAAGYPCRSSGAVRRADQAHPRIQAPVAEHS